MITRRVRWPRVRPLVSLLQTPAHQVVRVLQVTRSKWQVEQQGARKSPTWSASDCARFF